MTNDVIALTKELISIPSTVGDIQQLDAMLEFIKKQLPEYPFTSFVSNNFSSLLYSNQQENQKNFKILLSAHVDITAKRDSQFVPHEKNGKLYGRGVFDTKAATAAMILAFKSVAKLINYPLGLQVITDGTSIHQASVTQQLQQGLKSNFVIASEGTDFSIINNTKGRIILNARTNTTSRMHETIKLLADHYPTPKKETDETTLNILKIETTENDQCVAEIDIRYYDEDEKTIITKIKSLIPDIALETLNHFAPNKTSPENTYIKELQKSGIAISQKDLLLKKAHGVSHASMFVQDGIDTIEFGPKGNGYGHIFMEEEEWVDIKSLEQYYHILKTFLLSLK